MFRREVLEGKPFCNRPEVAVQTEAKKQTSVSVGEIVWLVEHYPRRVDALSLFRNAEASRDTRMKPSPPVLFLCELYPLGGHCNIHWPHQTAHAIPVNVEFLRD